jgi:nucleoside phosphorylase/tetratricopeptide (TPR) repeat protein
MSDKPRIVYRGMRWDANRRADVVILTAIRLEYDAAKEVDAGAVAGSQWETIDGPNGLPVAFREFTVANGRPLRIALAVSPEMGATAATNTLLPLVERLQPRCIAMCGVCAGRRGKTNLGDVVTAERLYYHDAGKRLPDEIQQDLTTYKLRDDWKVALEGLPVREQFGDEAWLQARPLTAEWRANRALHAMLAGASEPWRDIDPTMDEREWKAVLATLRGAKLVSKKNLSPTERGRQHIRNVLDANMGKLPDLSPTGGYLPFKLHVASMGSGTQVIEDEPIWSFVSRAMRKTLALEMESAALGELAHRQRERKLDAIVIKAVMDFADHGRDDHFKHFAARASAECLIWFLRLRVPTDRADQPDPLEGLDRMIDDHAPCVGRSDLLAELSRFVASSRSGRALLMAPTGMGKTAALIEWTRRLQSSPDVWPVFVPISRAYDHATPAAVLGRMVRKLQRCYGDGDPEPLVDVGRTPPVIYRYLQRAPPHDRKLVLVIDGIDEATGWKVPRTLVPDKLGERVRVVVAAREHANLDRARVCEQLGWSEATTTMLGEHPAVAVSHAGHADSLRDLGKLREAEDQYVHALAIVQNAKPLNELVLAMCLNNLGDIYRRQGQYIRAEPPLREALAIRMRHYGRQHLDIARSFHDLGLLHFEQGQYNEAEQLFRDAVAIRQALSQPGDPHIARALDSLARLCTKRGHYDEAEQLYQRALAIREKALGPEHPELACSLDGLAELYQARGQYAEAEPLYKRALAIREKALGPEHPDVVISLENYALLLRNMGRSEEAESLESRARANSG